MASRRVLLLVSNVSGHNTGRGGHLYTVADFFRALQTRLPVQIVCLGHEIPPPLRGLEPALIPIRTLGGIFAAARSLREMVEGQAVLHAFDATALLVARLARRQPVVFTKCGGAVTRRYTPAGHPDIVFHQEDFAHYARLGAPLPGRHFKLIPNRVYPVLQDDVGADAFPTCDALVMRIARVCVKYEESILQGIRLTKSFRGAGIDARFVCVGFPEDPAVVERIRSELGEADALITDEKMTVNASRHLPKAAVVVASGRGAMESAMLEKITFVPEKGRSLPALLDERTIKEGIYHNFSDRCRFSHRASEAEAIEILTDYRARNAYGMTLRRISDDYFDLRPKLDEYMSIYECAVRAPSMFARVDVAMHLANFLFFGVFRRVRRKFA
jgi:hypothetical protein